jgi:hypothetical protein
MAAVTVSVEKSKFLQAKLNEAKRENAKIKALEAELEQARSVIADLNSRS